MFQEIQAKIKARKSKFNKFGNYNYRNLEDIVEAAKPVLREAGCYLIISDELVMIGDRYYIKATATVHKSKAIEKANEPIGVIAQATGWAREAEIKKGMDASQITGSTSSYARKYAAAGLFGLDDGVGDPDSLEPEEDGSSYADWVAKIDESTTLESLKANFTEAHRALDGDNNAIKAITAKKDAKKKELS